MSLEVRSERLLTVFTVVESALAEPRNDPTLEIGFSREHINRLLRSFIGESLEPLTLRFRLERAAYGLLHGQMSVSDAAEMAGYADSEAFIKCFRSRYGLSPGLFRRTQSLTWRLPSPKDIHWNPSFHASIPLGDGTLVHRRAPKRLAAKLIVGDYALIPECWRQFCRDLPGRLTEGLGFQSATLFHDDGMREVDRELMRAHLGFVLNGETVPTGYQLVDVPGGVYLTTPVTRGDHEHWRFWSSLNTDWVSKRTSRKPTQPGLDEYYCLPSDWNQVQAQISLAITR